MERDNFFTLLKLDPSENDEAVILATIEKTVKRWRDNKEKGVDRAGYDHKLKLEPEMRRVMLDPYLRRKEAEALSGAKWADEFAKPLDALLKEVSSKLFSIYEFLSRDTDGNMLAPVCTTSDSIITLKSRATRLSEEYRQKNKATEQKICGKCLALLENIENKERYDQYITQKLTSEITGYIERFQQENILNTASYQTILLSAKSWFDRAQVKEVINDYCREKGYTVEESGEQYSRTTAPPTPPTNSGGYGNEADFEQAHRQAQQQYANVNPQEEDLVYVKKVPHFFIARILMIVTLGYYEVKTNCKIAESVNAMSALAFGDSAEKIKYSTRTLRGPAFMALLGLVLGVTFDVAGMLNTTLMVVFIGMVLFALLILVLWEYSLLSKVRAALANLAVMYGRQDVIETLGGNMFMNDHLVADAYNMLVDEHNDRVTSYGGYR